MPVVPTTYRWNNTNGTPLSLGNSGASFLSANGGSIVFSSAASDEGATGIAVTSVPGLIEQAFFPISSPSVVGAAGVGEFTRWDIPFWTPEVQPTGTTTDMPMLTFTNVAGGTGTTVLRLIYAVATGNIYMLGRGGTAAKLLLSAAPLNTKYVWQGYARVDSTASQLNSRLLNSARTVVGNTIAETAYNIGTGVIDEFRVGVLAAGYAQGHTIKADTARFETGVTSPAYMTAYVPPVADPPTVADIASQQKTVGEAFTVTASATDTAGTITGYSWRRISGNGPVPATNTATFSGTAPSTAGITVYGVIANSSTGLPSTEKTFTLNTNAATGSAVGPDRVVSNTGGWGYGGTATDLLDGLTDSGEWAITAAGPASAELTVAAPPVPATALTVSFKTVLKAADGTTLATVGQTGTLQVQIFSGTLAITQPQTVLVDRTQQPVTIQLSPSENLALQAANRADVRVVFQASSD